MVKVNVLAPALIAIVVIGIIAFFFMQAEPAEQTIGNFYVDTQSEVCQEAGRPIFYLFGSQSCPHCMWEDPVVRAVAQEFTGLVSLHDNIDTDNEKDVFARYSKSGYIPLIVIGCKYYRVGSGETLGEENEAKVLKALICSLTNKEPASVCSEVEDLISQI